MTTTEKRVYTGATLTEIHAVFEEYIAALTASDGPLPAGYRAEVKDALGGFADQWANQITHPEPADTRDPMTVDEWRKESGLCPDAGDHLFGPTCRRYECPTYLQAEYEDRVDETGRLR